MLTHCRWTGQGFGPIDQTMGGMARPITSPTGTLTHEQYVHAVRDHVTGWATLSDSERSVLGAAKLVYGAGAGHYRGICYFQAWQNGDRHAFVEIAATGEESAVQLAGTTIHELAHVLAGPVGHGAEWKHACHRLGLLDAQASGQVYTPGEFHSVLWASIAALGEPVDGNPAFQTLGLGGNPFIGLPVATARPCPMGRGTRGGKFGPGSGSRLRLWQCPCGIKARVASDEFDATCGRCGKPFEHQYR